MRIRRMEVRDLDGADVLLRAAFALPERSFLPRLQRYVALWPDGWLVATEGEDDGLVGTVGTLCYGSFAYVGLMAVAPAAQSRGVGRRLLEAALASLDRRGVRCAVLDATAAGAPLYERLGFVDAGRTLDFVRVGGTGAAPVGPVGSAAGVDAAAAVDRRCFGADRAPVWRRLVDEGFPLFTVGARGALVLQPGQIGPWVAADPEAAAQLLAAALAAVPVDTPVRVQVPSENAGAAALLRGAGFELRKALRHMRRGDPAAVPAWTHLYGKGSYCLG